MADESRNAPESREDSGEFEPHDPGAIFEWSENSVPVHGDLSHQRSREESTRKESIYERMPIVQCAYDATVGLNRSHGQRDTKLGISIEEGGDGVKAFHRVTREDVRIAHTQGLDDASAYGLLE